MHGSARIDGIDPTLLDERLAEGQVAVDRGLSGHRAGQPIFTLGRGGSDTRRSRSPPPSKADRCDIYTDVDGVYTTDPRIVPKARRLEKISFEEMLEMASLGAKVLQTRSVEIAMHYRVPGARSVDLRLPTLGGTLLCDEEDIVEKKPVTGIAYSRDEAKITLHRVLRPAGRCGGDFRAARRCRRQCRHDRAKRARPKTVARRTSPSPCARTELARALATRSKRRRRRSAIADLTADGNVAKISVIGIGMRTHAGVAQSMFRTLSEKGINIQVISTSEIKVSVLIAEEYVELAVRALHSAFELDVA